MKRFWIFAGMALLAGFIAFFIRSRGGETVMAGDLDRMIVQPYIAAVAAGEYQRAYSFLGSAYRREVSLARFREAHEKRRTAMGKVTQSKLLKDQTLRTIFSSKREVRLFYELDYDGKKVTGWVLLEEEDGGRFAIEGTYRETAGETLDFVLW